MNEVWLMDECIGKVHPIDLPELLSITQLHIRVHDGNARIEVSPFGDTAKGIAEAVRVIVKSAVREATNER